LPINWREIEEKWQKAWDEAKIFETDPKARKPKFFITVAYPYPNSPQHVGHGRTFTLTDVYARYKRMRGFNALLPMAFHYTGTPILAMSKRLAAGDEDLLDDFIRVYKVPQEVIKTFTEPIKIAEYFHKEIRQGMKEIGYSIDWRREFTTIDPQYKKFIEWQFGKLKAKGLITKGSHPVGWCPSDGNPVGQHDTKGDVEPEIGEFTVIKFKYGEYYLPAATLRPETIFGVTNMWLRPDINYVEVKIDGERWIISKECAEKLKFLNRKVTVVGNISGKSLIGKYVKNPATDEEIPILPAQFVDPNNATGVVMSVPGHAPYDYIALEDLKKQPSELQKYGIRKEVLEKVKPISIIKLDGYSEFPAADALKHFEIKNQLDPNVEDATKEVYSHEFHSGKMKDNTGKYAGMSVSQAKNAVKEDLSREAKADAMYELLNKPIYCRCGTECVVKLFEDQWFINYGDPEWKNLAYECLANMKIVPEDLRSEFEHTINWLKEKACARKQGLGTKLPWDPEWIIESLSDSVIYMSYYIISKYINQYKIPANKFDDDIFNYIFLGSGNPDIVANKVGLDPMILKRMRNEFTYFYPLDSRNSGRDLVPNHLTFFIFNHAAIFPKKLWPCQIVVNGSVLMEGKKMSKSFGNIIPLREAIKTYGADPFRLAVLATAELLQDADFSNSLAKSINERLERFYAFALEVIKMREETKGSQLTSIDKWMLSSLQYYIRDVTEAMENLRVREAVHNALYLLDQDIQWYSRRTSAEPSNPERKGTIASVLNEVLDARVRLLTPFAPHLCEEIWRKANQSGFVSVAQWPSYDETRIDTKVIEQENLIKATMDDTLSIIQATGITAKRICYYTSAKWKWTIYLKALKMAESGSIKVNDFMKELMADPELKKMAKDVAKYVQAVSENINKIYPEIRKRRLAIGIIDELKTLEEAKNFFKQEFHTEVNVFTEDDPRRYDPKRRAALAEPYRPAIYIE